MHENNNENGNGVLKEWKCSKAEFGKVIIIWVISKKCTL